MKPEAKLLLFALLMSAGTAVAAIWSMAMLFFQQWAASVTFAILAFVAYRIMRSIVLSLIELENEK